LPEDASIKYLRNQKKHPFGFRVDGTPKGKGFLGVLPRLDGGFSTEISIGVNFDGKETLIPLIVPTLDADELNILLSTPLDDPDFFRKIPEKIIDKAVEHAKGRMLENLSPFYD